MPLGDPLPGGTPKLETLSKMRGRGLSSLITLPITLSGDVSHPYRALRYGRAKKSEARVKGRRANDQCTDS